MEQPEKFTTEQRKALADMLKPNGSVRDEALTRYRTSRDEREQSLVKQIAEEKFALPIVANILKAREQLKTCEAELTTLGFHLSSEGELETNWSSGSSIRNLIDKRLTKELGTQNTVIKQFDSALLKVWTTATTDEAKAIVEALL